MCGIAGFIDPTRLGDAEGSARLARAMADTIAHRGPDEGEAWADPASGVGLGFRRLAIIDVSAAGRQPMRSASGRYTIVYNGEIYNAEDLRGELGPRAPHWRGHSDTEVLLAAIEAYGFDAALRRVIGMFAIALWDGEERRLLLARDRLGKKPLYWARAASGAVVFGSELRALLAHPGITRTLDRDAVALYLRHGYVPHPRTIYAGISQLPPGHVAEFSGRSQQVRAYWSLADTVAAGAREPFAGSAEEAVDALDRLLADAVRRRLVSDVPLGALLSGGIDSSTIVALMQAQSRVPVRTFAIGFGEASHDESVHARAVARHLGADHTELIVTPDMARDVIPSLPDIYDEPFADSSAIPTYLVSRLARQHVTVALSGDGGDELFSGYTRYGQAEQFERRVAALAAPIRRAGASAVRALSPETWTRLLGPLGIGLAGDKLHKLAPMLDHTPDGFYRELISLWSAPCEIVRGAADPPTVMSDPAVERLMPDFASRMMYRDTMMYLPDDILTKVDRASMAVSLEARAPLLDHRVVALAWSLPMSLSVRDGERKWILRRVLDRYVPRTLVDRPKAGFAVPIGAWLRGPLKAWAEDLLSAASLARDDLLEPQPIRQRWQEHLSGARNWQHQLWAVLMLEAWRRRHA